MGDKTGIALARKRHRSRGEMLGWVVAVPVVLAMIVVVATNENFQWATVGSYLTVPAIMEGLAMTLQLTFVCMIIGIVLGVVLAVMVRSKSPLLSGLAAAYIWFFRGTPLLVQLIFWFNLAALFPDIGIGAMQLDVNSFITPFFAAVLGLALHESAYMAEIVRSGLLAVDDGQKEAAEALGMRPRYVLLTVVLPQAMRSIIPPTGNQTIGMLKSTSLVSVLGVAELLHSAQIIYSRTYETIPLLIVASLWYLAMTTVLSIGQYYLERYFDKGSARRPRTKKPAAPTGAISIIADTSERTLR
jgi:polar amino acid transport system permease protein